MDDSAHLCLASSLLPSDAPRQFTDPITRELLGFEALVLGHQYLTLSLVSVAASSARSAAAIHARERSWHC
jgi:hypothetical protein